MNEQKATSANAINWHTDITGDAVRGSKDPGATLRAAGIRGLQRQAGYIPLQMSNEQVSIQLDLFGSYRLIEFDGMVLDYLYDQWAQAANSLFLADLSVSAQVPGGEADSAQCSRALGVVESIIHRRGGVVPDYDEFSLEQWGYL